MKSSTVLAAIATAVLLAVCMTAAPLQNPPAAAPGAPGAQGAPGGPGAQTPPGARGPSAAQEKTATGQLSKVDLSKKEITIKSADNKEMVFEYNDATQMTGVDNSAQGLSGKTGSTLRVTYREAGGKDLATRIEVQGGGGAGAPGARGGDK